MFHNDFIKFIWIAWLMMLWRAILFLFYYVLIGCDWHACVHAQPIQSIFPFEWNGFIRLLILISVTTISAHLLINLHYIGFGNYVVIFVFVLHCVQFMRMIEYLTRQRSAWNIYTVKECACAFHWFRFDAKRIIMRQYKINAVMPEGSLHIHWCANWKPWHCKWRSIRILVFVRFNQLPSYTIKCVPSYV